MEAPHLCQRRVRYVVQDVRARDLELVIIGIDVELLSGYDRRWSMASGTGATQIAQHGKHTEFVCGRTFHSDRLSPSSSLTPSVYAVAWSLFECDIVPLSPASCPSH